MYVQHAMHLYESLGPRRSSHQCPVHTCAHRYIEPNTHAHIYRDSRHKHTTKSSIIFRYFPMLTTPDMCTPMYIHTHEDTLFLLLSVWLHICFCFSLTHTQELEYTAALVLRQSDNDPPSVRPSVHQAVDTLLYFCFDLTISDVNRNSIKFRLNFIQAKVFVWLPFYRFSSSFVK